MRSELKKAGELFFLRKDTSDVICKIDIEISDEEERSEKGMMNRDTINDDQGLALTRIVNGSITSEDYPNI